MDQRNAIRRIEPDMTHTTAPDQPISPLLAAKRAADLCRAEWLMMVTTGMILATDLFDEAVNEESRPLRRLRVNQVLAAQDGWTIQRANRVLTRMAQTVKMPSPASKVTVGWLTDARSRGRRLRALDEFMADHTLGDGQTPWTGGLR